MSLSETIFKVIEDNNCPLYALGDEFKLSGKALMLDHDEEKTFVTTAIIKVPKKKPACLVLISDITSVLVEYGNMSSLPEYQTSCSGCTGTIRLGYKRNSVKELEKREKFIDKIATLLSNFSMFQSIDKKHIKELVPLLKYKQFNKGDRVIQKGDPGTNLYIILSGSVEVVGDKNVSMAFLGKGDVFGEMSLLSGDSVGATIEVVDTTRVLYMNGRNFRKILYKYPALQMYFAKLLAMRLAKTNVERSDELASGMTGRLSEMAPTELFQTLNTNQKTGVLTLQLTGGRATLVFNDGDLVRAEFGDLVGKEAFFKLLEQKEGRFKFHPKISDADQNAAPIADFMWLLMEGLNRLDEAGQSD